MPAADIVEVSIKGLMPAPNGCAVFLGNEDKVFVIYVDPSVGSAISMTINGVKKERPLTHDLIGHLLMGFEITLERIVINDVNDGTYFARIILHMQNELGRKFLELDARPSDSIVLALQQKRPIFVARRVFDLVEDMTEILERVLKQQKEEPKDEGDPVRLRRSRKQSRRQPVKVTDLPYFVRNLCLACHSRRSEESTCR